MTRLSNLSRKWSWILGIVCVFAFAVYVYAAVIEGSAGNYAKVTSEGQLEIFAVIETEERSVSRVKKQAYFVSSGASNQVTHTSTATGGYILYLENESTTHDLVLQKVLTNSDTAAITFAWMKNPTLGTISNHNESTQSTLPPVNLSFESGNVADATTYTWNETGNGLGGLTSGTTVHTTIAAIGFTAHPIDGAIELEKNDIFALQVFGAGEISASVRFYYKEKPSTS